jgi:hypothetical protein
MRAGPTWGYQTGFLGCKFLNPERFICLPVVGNLDVNECFTCILWEFYMLLLVYSFILGLYILTNIVLINIIIINLPVIKILLKYYIMPLIMRVNIYYPYVDMMVFPT